MEVLIGIILIIWTILCLILFFKIWGATDDINTLKQKFCHNQSQQGTSLLVSVRELYFLDKIDEAEKEITSDLVANIKQIVIDLSYIEEDKRETEFKQRYSKKLEVYDRIYKAIGKDIPTQLKDITYKKWVHFSYV